MVIYQVKRFLFQYGLKQTYLSQFLHNTRYKSTSVGTLHPLLSRNLLKISGEDTAVFLQGLITNDIKHFDEGAKSMYAMFLNNKGRVLYDTLIYKWGDKDTFMLECDKSVINLIQKHLKIYKLKRKIDIVDVNTELRLWALTTPNIESKLDFDPNENINVYKDPRLTDLGYRIISPVHLNGVQVANTIVGEITSKTVDDDYKYLRYTLGVSEGVNEIEPETSFPLEMNCDYLHGVSFHKGCYIGQELTARVYHTGVIRKRVMPIKFSKDVQDSIEKNSIIIDSDNPKTNIGKLKAYIKDYGIGLVRIKEARNAKELKIANYSVEAVKPSWWPLEAPKEKTLSKFNMEDKKLEEPAHVEYEFKCSSCNIHEKAQYKGTSPPFSRNIVLKYPSYVMKDPFSPPGKGEILVLGADCALCQKPVCINKECSIFFLKTFCLPCTIDSIDQFPVEIKNKIAQLKLKNK